MVVAMCGDWSRPRGGLAGAWSIAATEQGLPDPHVKKLRPLAAGAFVPFLLSLKICQSGAKRAGKRKQISLQRLGTPSPDRTKSQGMEPVMKSPNANHIESLDGQSSQSICEAVGERLQQTLRPNSTDMSSYLRDLMDKLRKRDEEDRLRSH
jgi:hypothetical protein